MSEDKLSREARKAYAETQKDFDKAAAHEAESAETDHPHSETGDKNDKGDQTAAAKPGKKSKDSAKADPKEKSGDKTIDEAGDSLEGELAKAQEDRITGLNEELEQAKDDLARARADLYNLQQEYNNYAKRTKAEIPLQQEAGVASVVNALMGVLDDVDLARQHGDLEGTFAAVATKLENTLETRFKVKRYGVVGEEFDPTLHQAIQMADGSTGTGRQVINAVAQPGYLMGDRVLRAAMVVVGLAADHAADEATDGAEAKQKGDE